MSGLLQDLRFSIRMLLKKPGFSVIAIVTLGLGIGANTAIFSVVHGVLLQRLPYRDHQRIVTLWQNNLASGVEREETSPATFLDWRERLQSCEMVAAAEPFGHSMIGHGEPERFRSWIVSVGFFDILGVPAHLGRTFRPEEYQTGSHHVVVVGYRLWQDRFGGDTGLVGQKLVLNGQPHTVVGVMPPEFQFPAGREMWAPRPPREYDGRIRGGTYIKVVGRLKPEVTPAQAQAEINSIAAQLADEYPETNGQVGAVVVPLREHLVGQVRPALLLFFGAVCFVLLIACANVANLLMVRAMERAREFAIRSALGAGRGRLLRQSLTESVVLALSGGLVGVWLSGWLLDLIVALNPGNLPRIDQLRIGGAVLAFALGVSVLTALIFGLVPALQVGRRDIQETLKEGGRGVTLGRRWRRFRSALVVTEVALALTLLVGAGLLLRSFDALLSVDPGFAARSALTLEVQIGRRPVEQRTAFINQTLERLATLSGVEAVGVTSALPFHDNQVLLPTSFRIEERPSADPGQDPTAYAISITPDYPRALGLPLIRGRQFTDFDTVESAPVVLINQTAADRHWPGEDPLGRRIGFQMLGREATCEIVGIVGDARPQGLDSEPRPEIYVPYAQSPSGSMAYLVRTSGDPVSFLPAVKQKIREVDPNMTFAAIASIDQLMDRSISGRRFNLFLFAAFAVLALVLTSVGLYGLMSSTTAQRTHEIGVRMALGAQATDIIRLVLKRGVLILLCGVVIGAVASLALTWLMRSLLFGVSPVDPLTFLGMALLLATVAIFACYVPARRAARVDPMVALRYE